MQERLKKLEEHVANQAGLSKKFDELLETTKKLQKDFELMKKDLGVFKEEFKNYKQETKTFSEQLKEDLAGIGKKVDLLERNKSEVKSFDKVYVGNGTFVQSKSTPSKNYLSMSIEASKLDNLPDSNAKGSKYLAVTELKEPNQFGHTHSIHNRIDGDKYSKINICFSKDDLEKLHRVKAENGKDYINFYVSEISSEKKAEKNITADYAIYQVNKEDKDKESLTQFVGAGFDAQNQKTSNKDKEDKTHEPER